MRLGVTTFPTQTGLGYQSKSYVKHLNPTKVLAIDLTGYNGMPYMHDWFPQAQYIVGYPNERDMLTFCQDLDVILFAVLLKPTTFEASVSKRISSTQYA
jgi:hypothetical protein